MASTTKELFEKVYDGQFYYQRRPFRDRKHNFWSLNDGLPEGSELRIPLLGIAGEMRYQKMEDDSQHPLDGIALEFYLVDPSGQECRILPEGRPQGQFQAIRPTVETVAELLGVSPSEVAISHAEGESWLHDYEHRRREKDNRDDTHDEYKWAFFHVRESVFREIHEKKGFIVVADQQDASPIFPGDASRTVFPAEVRVQEVPKQLDVGSMEIRYIKHHRNCVEYRAKTGEQVFDHRMAEYDPENRLPMGNHLWRLGLRRYVNQLMRSVDKNDRAKQLLGHMLHNLSSDDHPYGEIKPEQKMNMINQMLLVLTNSAYFPLSMLLDDPQHEYEVRKAYKDTKWGELDWCPSENTFNAEYIVLRNKPIPDYKYPERKPGFTFSLGDCPSPR